MIVLVKLTDEGAVHLRKQELALDIGQHVKQPDMIFFGETNVIMLFRLVIRRIAIKKGGFRIIVFDNRPEVLVLNENLRKPAVCRPYQVERPSDVVRLTAYACASACVAVPYHLEKGRRPADIVLLRPRL